MSEISTYWDWFLGIAISSAIATSANCALAQITPDGTLPNNSIVNLNGSTFNITGGTQAGGNLFHSFQQFSVPTGSAAIFNNTIDIQNIISRVTGGSISNIDGLIRSLGTANLFLINPNGIVFGQNASLNVGGSFVASTANAIQFGNQGIFSVTNPETPSPLLTINPTALLFNQIGARIQNRSTAPAGVAPTGLNSSGLRVPDGKSLLLVGGEIEMDRGRLRAYGGRVEMGGLAEPGSVALSVDGNNLSLGFPNNITRSDVSLTNGSSVLVEAAGGGSIAVNARNLDVLGESTLGAGIGQGLGSVDTVAGDITLNVTGEIKVVGEQSGVFNNLETRAVGKGGNINVTTGSLSVTDGARLQASTRGTGDTGNVFVQAKDSVSVTGRSDILNTVSTGAVGNGGNITISSGSLSLTDGSQIVTTTFGQGNAGNVFVNVGGAVTAAGENGLSSGINSYVSTRAVGNGGDITITSGSLSLIDGANLFADTLGQGNAGNVFVQAKDFVSLIDGAQISTTTFGRGDAGNVFVNAGGAVTVAGEKNGVFSAISSNVSSRGVGNGGDITITSGSLSLIDGANLIADTRGQGNAGNVFVQAKDSVSVTGSSGFFVQSQSSGAAGDIEVSTPQFRLDNTGTISARSASGNGGNINLKVRDLLLLRRGGLISATAGTARQDGNGGNITIDAPNGFVVAVPDENSDITANAFNGSGGVITINSLDVFNFTQRSREDLVRELGTDDPNLLNPQRLQTNDITAFSQNNPTFEGQISINTRDLDQNLELVELPTVLADTSALVNTSCAAFDSGGSTFTVTGRGGLPPSPDEPLTNDVLWSDTRIPQTTTQQHSSKKPAAPLLKPKSEPVAIVPATGWVFNGKGEVTLISSAPNATGLRTTPATCPRH